MEQFIKIADNAVEEHKEELISVFRKILEKAACEVYSNGLTTRNFADDEKTSWSDSWEWIILKQRMSSDVGFVFDLDMEYFKNKEGIYKYEAQ
jgi:hypothetical protein